MCFYICELDIVNYIVRAKTMPLSNNGLHVFMVVVGSRKTRMLWVLASVVLTHVEVGVVSKHGCSRTAAGC